MFRQLQKILLAATALVPLSLAPVAANPLGAQVVGGNANVQGQGTANVTVQQNTNKAIINWNTFNIGANEAVQFLQPSSSSVTLNRVTGGLGPSEIFGSLSANGKLFVVNPDGILIGSGAKIDAAGFLATTNDIANADFMAGHYNFSIPGRPDASVVNQGTITAQSGGFAALVAPGVRNSGTITATLGIVALASGNVFSLDFYGDKLITLGVNDSVAASVKDVGTGQPLSSLVSNEGKLKADGGTVELTAVAVRQVVDSVINNTGVIEANTIGTQNGMIVLGAATEANKPAGAPTQMVKVSGTLSAVGAGAGTKGGTIQVTGESIAVAGATLNAFGHSGGGKVLIGGDVGGGKPSTVATSIPQAQLQPYAVPTATKVTVDAGTTINVSASNSGDGGKAVVWSSGTTAFTGLIFALGGANGGNGGFVETSGHTLDFVGARVFASAPYGKSGLWLLDPTDLTIDATAAGTISSNLNLGSNVAIQTTAFGASGPGNQSTGNGDIIVNSAISWGSANTLTLNALHDIAINAGISSTNGGLTLNAANNITAIAAVNVGAFTLAGGNWNQVTTDTLAGFSANDFRITGGSFLRAGGGNGSAGAPYQLTDIYGLQGIGSSSTLLSNFYVLANNINAAGTTGWNSGAGFVPIGNGVTFTGQLDGQTYAVDKLTIAPISANISQIGLFGIIGTGGVVQNLNLTNVGIYANPNLGTGFQSVGALAGYNAGLVDHVTASGTVNGGAVNGLFAGGLVGQNGFFDGSTVTGGTIQNSSAAVNVTLGDGVACNGTSCDNGRTNIAGGLVGVNPGTITGSSASGDVIVGANAQAGGLAGTNQVLFGASIYPVPLIDSSFATGNVSSGGVNVQIGGLVGYNSPGALITSSFATGTVTASAAITSNNGVDCSISGNCQYENAGGLIGYNSGTVLGTAESSSTQACEAGQTCAAGAVSVGSNATGGGLVGSNDGIIAYAFATGAVTGAAGASAPGHNGNQTSLGGFAGSNQGLIMGSHATGNVGTFNIANLQVGGLVADNAGVIWNSYATGNVSAGDNSQAGGLAANNGPWDNSSCGSCITADGYVFSNLGIIGGGGNLNLANIDLSYVNNTGPSFVAGSGYSYATGNVTVGTASLAGGLSASSGQGGFFYNTYATGMVSGGGNSILGGLVGVADVGAVILNSEARGSVTSTGSNSWIGGFIGLNAGIIGSAGGEGPVTGTSNSLIGGFAGLNLGTIADSTTATSSTVTGTGTNNFVGGFVGVNFGFIDPSTSAGSVTGGTNNTVGGFAGANANLTGITAGVIPGSTFPFGLISADSNATGLATGGANSTVGAQVGTTNPAALPTSPAIVASCDKGALCSILQAGFALAYTAPTQPSAPEPPLVLPPQVTDVTPPVAKVDFDLTIPPPILPNNLTTGSISPQPLFSGVLTNSTPGVPDFTPPPLPPRSVPGPNGEIYSSVPPPGENRFFDNLVLLELGLDISDADLVRIAQQLGLRIITSDTLTALGRKVVRFELPPGMTVRDAILRLEANRLVSIAAPIYKFGLTQASSATNEEEPAQYAVAQLHLDKAHAIATGKGVTIAVIDSEVDKRHTELKGAISLELDTLSEKEPPQPHGTAMAGAIVSRGRLTGVAPGAQILAVRAFSKSNNTAEATTVSILKGIEWALSHGARIINMSFAGPRDPALERALKAAHDKGVVLVAAAGNAGPKSPPLYPAADPNVIAVTATNESSDVFRGANQGPQVSVAAPGVDVLAVAPEETYQVSTGTSIAAAHVSGVAALMLELDPTLKPDQLRKILESTATDLGPKGKDTQFGWGLVNPQKALEVVTARLATGTVLSKRVH